MRLRWPVLLLAAIAVLALAGPPLGAALGSDPGEVDLAARYDVYL